METYCKAKQIYLSKFNRITQYQIMRELHEAGWDIRFMCKCLGISRSAYYKWLNKKPSEREAENERIITLMREIDESNNGLFGYEKMTYEVNRRFGTHYNRKRIHRLRAIIGMRSSFRRKPAYHYRKSQPEQTAENILGRDFNTTGPNEKWVSDITEIRIPTTNIKLYISSVLDLYDRFPVGLSVSRRNDTILTDDVLEKAHETYPDAHPIFHTDRGFQYTRAVFRNKLESYGMTQSMSRVSKCIDNGVCEGFQGIFKELLFILYPGVRTEEQMMEAIHGTLDYYINRYPQKRFKGKTAGEVRKEALATMNPVVYPIMKNNRITKFWEKIAELKKVHKQ